jgi:hypothetical protein
MGLLDIFSSKKENSTKTKMDNSNAKSQMDELFPEDNGGVGKAARGILKKKKTGNVGQGKPGGAYSEGK